MIYERTMYSAKCDNCKAEAQLCGDYAAMTEKSDVEDDLAWSDWWIDYDKNIHYCPDCFYIGDEDEPVLKKIEK